MNCIIVLSFIFTTVEIYISAATEILYVIPENTTNAACCPSQPCATLSHLLVNSTLPVMSNVEYHFLPGEHHVPANMILQGLHNFSIIGIFHNSSPVVLVGCLQWYVINILDSHFVTIKNVVFKHCGIVPDDKTQLTNLRMFCCFSCKIQDVTFMQYGLTGFNLIGESYLHNIKIDTMQFSQLCCQVISLQYTYCLSWNNYSTYMHRVSLDHLSISNYANYKTRNDIGLHIHVGYTTYHLKIFIKNSFFAIWIKQLCILKQDMLLQQNRFLLQTVHSNLRSTSTTPAIIILLSPFNKTVSFIDCEFRGNKELIEIVIAVCGRHTCELIISDTTFPMILTNISFVRCQFINNNHTLLKIENKAPTLGKANVLFKSLSILDNFLSSKVVETNMISIIKMNVRINGTFNVTKNTCSLRLRVMRLIFNIFLVA